MTQLLILADDFTGALDTGVQFATVGAVTRVITGQSVSLSEFAGTCEVLVVDAETRHLTAAKAADIVGGYTAQAAALGIPHIYKKTDSALRGNVGAELAAVLENAGERSLPFLPAFPQMGRNTIKGIHYIQGVPVADSVFGNGRWIYGNWICTDAVDGLAGDPSAFRISDDQGKTWKMVMMPKSNGRVHATVVELDDGHLVAFMRSREADFIYRSESFDWGDSWSEPKPTVLPNNNSSISAIRTQSGRIAIAYNPTCVSEDMRSKCAWPGLRCPVAVALSEDGGETFPMIRWMERGEGYIGDENKTNNKQYEYPYLMQSADGRLHLTYAAFTRKAVKYVSFTEADVMGAKRERYGVYNPTSGEGARDAK